MSRLLYAREATWATCRGFKTKTSQAQTKLKAQQMAKAATGGRDPYGLFKEAIASPANPEADNRKRTRQQQRRDHRAEYSRALMNEVHESHDSSAAIMPSAHTRTLFTRILRSIIASMATSPK